MIRNGCVILQVFSNYQAIASRTFSVSLIVEFIVSSLHTHVMHCKSCYRLIVIMNGVS